MSDALRGDPHRVFLQGYEIRVRPVVLCVRVPVDLGDGCVNDTYQDQQGWEASFAGRTATGLTPEDAAENVMRLLVN